LADFIATHGSSRFESAWGLEESEDLSCQQGNTKNEKVINRAGYRKLISGVWKYYFYTSSFQKDILQDGDTKPLIKELASKGVLVTTLEKARDGNEKIRYSSIVHVPGAGNKRLYEISNEALQNLSDSTL